MKTLAHAPKTPTILFTSSPFSLVITFTLIVSGLLHLWLLWMESASWDGAVSLRKPALFGVSAGLTVWSLAWIATTIREQKWSGTLLWITAISLLVEVGLITLQYWRGVPSHFNRATALDAAIESSMLGLIGVASIGVFWFTIQTWWLKPLPPGYAVAIRGGMWLLTVSCVLGGVITVVGEYNRSNGLPAEQFGASGVLKYPHGAAIHALQLLPFVAFVLTSMNAPRPAIAVASVLVSQILLVLQAAWQTVNGLGRMDLNLVGGALLLASVAFLLPPLISVLVGLARFLRSNFTENVAQIPCEQQIESNDQSKF